MTMHGELFADVAEAALERGRLQREAVLERASRGAAYTPLPVATACLEAGMPAAVRTAHGYRRPHGPLRILDVCAGAGGWSEALLNLWLSVKGSTRRDLHITAVELDPRERAHLERWCDRVIIDDWTAALRHEYDVVIGNPDFALLRAPSDGAGGYDVERSMPAQLLAVAPAVLLFSRLGTWSKDGPGVAVRRVYPAAVAWEVPGSIHFHAPGTLSLKARKKDGTPQVMGADQHSYAAFLWWSGHTGPTVCDILPDLPAEDRRWTVRPGTEP